MRGGGQFGPCWSARTCLSCCRCRDRGYVAHQELPGVRQPNQGRCPSCAAPSECAPCIVETMRAPAGARRCYGERVRGVQVSRAQVAGILHVVDGSSCVRTRPCWARAAHKGKSSPLTWRLQKSQALSRAPQGVAGAGRAAPIGFLLVGRICSNRTCVDLCCRGPPALGRGFRGFRPFSAARQPRHRHVP